MNSKLLPKEDLDDVMKMRETILGAAWDYSEEQTPVKQ